MYCVQVFGLRLTERVLSSELDYQLPPELIAQSPARPRERARLLRLERVTQTLTHHTIAALPDLLRPDDLLIFNDSRVLRARVRGFRGRQERGTNGTAQGGGRVEGLLLRERAVNTWEALLKPSARLRPAMSLTFVARDGSAQLVARVGERLEEGWLLHFECEGDVREWLPRVGEVPLPPYIAPPEGDIERDYQTVYARHEPALGAALDSAAAPTAGLHFDEPLLAQLRERGVQWGFVTLGVGAGTFRPVQTATLEEHSMHREAYEVPAHTAQLIAQQRARGGRVVAVGTTSARTLESAHDGQGGVRAGYGETQLFIRPPYRFGVVDAMLTNFHLPRSTLLAMIAALCGPENVGERGVDGREVAPLDATNRLTGLKIVRYAYEEAVRLRYRFFSWGDAMLIE